jgi:hypothetical protein
MRFLTKTVLEVARENPVPQRPTGVVSLGAADSMPASPDGARGSGDTARDSSCCS